MRGGREKVDPAEWFDREEIERARADSRATQRNNIAMVCGLAVVFVASMVARLPARLIAATHVHVWALQVIMVAVALLVAIEILGLPFDARLHAHRVERGEAGSEPFWRETSKGFIQAVAVLVPILLGLDAIIRWTTLWWMLVASFVALVLLAFRLVPLSRRHQRVEDVALEDRLRRLARDAGVPTLEVYVGPRAAGSMNVEATIVGVGRQSRIVLSEDVLKRPTKEIDVYLAQKISSWRRGTLRRKVIALVLAAPLPFLPAALLIASPRIQRLLGATSRSDPRMLPALLLVLLPSLSGVAFLMNWQARRHILQADVDALNFTRDPDTFEQMIRAQCEKLRLDLAPSFVQKLRSSFPPPADRLALAERWRKDRRVAVLFTDVEDATPLVERLGDEAWYDVLQDHNEILRKHVAVHRGREPASAGDGFLFVFDDVGEALICAIEIQRDLHRYAVERGIDIRVRMGVHTGEVIRKGDAVIGREVHVAARIASAAAGGQILVSDKVHDALAATWRFRFGNEHVLTLKGLSGTYRTFDVDWAESPTEARSLQQRPA